MLSNVVDDQHFVSLYNHFGSLSLGTSVRRPRGVYWSGMWGMLVPRRRLIPPGCDDPPIRAAVKHPRSPVTGQSRNSLSLSSWGKNAWEMDRRRTSLPKKCCALGRSSPSIQFRLLLGVQLGITCGAVSFRLKSIRTKSWYRNAHRLANGLLLAISIVRILHIFGEGHLPAADRDAVVAPFGLL